MPAINQDAQVVMIKQWYRSVVRLSYSVIFLSWMLIYLPLSAGEEDHSLKNNITTNNEVTKCTLILRYLILREGFGYTLFGSKPLSCVSCTKDPLFLIDSVFEPNAYSISRVYWPIWQQYSSRLCFNNFIFVENSWAHTYEIYLINKKLCVNTIKRHLCDFQRILRTDKEPKVILNQILHSKNIFKEGLCGSHYLMGLLFGYGKNNALAFEKLYVKKQYFYKALQPFSSEQTSDPIIMPLPRFVVTKHSEEDTAETKMLRRVYNQQRNHIHKIYHEKNFLEITLKKLQE